MGLGNGRGPFHSIAAPVPLPHGARFSRLVIAGAVFLIQVQVDSALAGKLYSADI